MRASTSSPAFDRSRQWAAAWRVGQKWPFRCTPTTASHSASDIENTIRSRRMPALLTSTSRRPNASTASATMRPASSKLVMSAPLTIASPPMSSIAATTSLAGPRSDPVPSGRLPRSFTTTWAPSDASIRACSRPMPRPAPVTIATRPSHNPTIAPSPSFLTATSSSQASPPATDPSPVHSYPGSVDRRTKIVATVGPASDQPETLRAMIRAGVDMVRLSLSHGPLAETLIRVQRVREAAEAEGKIVGVLADLPGPKIRAAAFPEGGVHLAEGARLEVVPAASDDTSSAHRIAVDHAALLEDLRPGDVVVLGDGAIRVL